MPCKCLSPLTVLFALSIGSALAAPTQEPAQVAHPALAQIAAAVQPDELRATIAHLVSFGTRHTMSDTTSRSRGIGAARRGAGCSRASRPSAAAAMAACK